MLPRARLYWSVRTAHLERARQLPSARIYFAGRRYDFDNREATGLDLVPAAGLRAAWLLFRDPPAVLEVNEPLMAASARWTVTALAALDLRRLLGGRRTTVVSYAIENRDPSGDAGPGLRGKLAGIVRRWSMRRIWHRVDRIAFGTAGAQTLYRDLFGAAPGQATLVEALPNAVADEKPKRRHQALFVSAFAERKGVPLLLEAWPQVVKALPDARLTMIGKGALTAAVLSAADEQGSIEVVVDPPRKVIHAALAEASAVVLPSQAAAGWREQVGLPIVEGLANGCTIVTTDQTGLADWLGVHDHEVIAAGGEPATLAQALIAALDNPIDPSRVRAALPATDGRLAADEWLFSGK